MNWHKLTIRILAAVFIFMTIGAIASHVLWRTAPLNGVGSASFLFIAGALLLLTSTSLDRKRLIVIGILGYLAEVLGVNGGWLFGRYEYSPVLAPNFFAVPLAMICAWFLLIGYVDQLLRSFSLTILWQALFVGSWMTVIDLMLDPVAANAFKFWNWSESGAYYGIPLRNFVGWFVASVIISGIEQVMYPQRIAQNPWAQIIGASIIAMYAICALIYGYFIAGSVGIGLLCLHCVINLVGKKEAREIAGKLKSQIKVS